MTVEEAQKLHVGDVVERITFSTGEWKALYVLTVAEPPPYATSRYTPDSVNVRVWVDTGGKRYIGQLWSSRMRLVSTDMRVPEGL